MQRAKTDQATDEQLIDISRKAALGSLVASDVGL